MNSRKTSLKSDFRSLGSIGAGLLIALALIGGAWGRSAAASTTVPTYELDVAHGVVDKTLGPVRALSCYRSDGTNAGPALALSRLQARAAALGANAVIDVRFTSFTDVPKSPCWRRTVVRGVAVVLRPANASAQNE